MQPHRWQPTRLRRPWDSPGENTGVGYHFLLQYVKVKSPYSLQFPALPAFLLNNKLVSETVTQLKVSQYYSRLSFSYQHELTTWDRHRASATMSTTLSWGTSWTLCLSSGCNTFYQHLGLCHFSVRVLSISGINFVLDLSFNMFISLYAARIILPNSTYTLCKYVIA